MDATLINMSFIRNYESKLVKRNKSSWTKTKSTQSELFDYVKSIPNISYDDIVFEGILTTKAMTSAGNSKPSINKEIEKIISAELLLQKLKEVAYAKVGFQRILNEVQVNEDVEGRLQSFFNFTNEVQDTQDTQDLQDTQPGYESSQVESSDSESDYEINYDQTNYIVPELTRSSSFELLNLNDPVRDFEEFIQNHKVSLQDVSLISPKAPDIKSINFRSENDYILCTIIFEKGDTTYTTTVKNFKNNGKYISLLEKAIWKKTAKIVLPETINNYQYEGLWETGGYGVQPQVESYSKKNFKMSHSDTWGTSSYIYNDHKLNVENQFTLYLDMVYPQRDGYCKVFVMSTLVSHRYYLKNIENLEIEKGLVWLASANGMSAFYCYKSAFEMAGFKFNGEYKTSLYNGVTFPLAYLHTDNKIYYKLQTDKSTDRIFLTKEEAKQAINSVESTLIAFIRGAEAKADYEPITKKEIFKYSPSFANNVFDLMNKTYPSIFKIFLDKFKDKDGIEIENERIPIRVGRNAIKHHHIQNAMDSVINDLLISLKRKFNSVRFDETDTRRWVWNQSGAKTDVSIRNYYEMDGLDEWVYKERGDYNTLDQVNDIFQKMKQDNKAFFNVFREMFNNAWFKSYTINENAKLCSKEGIEKTNQDRGRAKYNKKSLDNQYDYLTRSKRNFPMKYSVHMAFELTEKKYDILYMNN